MDFATSFAQLSNATGFSRSTLHEKQKRGQIPQRGPQGWRIAEVITAIDENTDPARRSDKRSAERSEPNAEQISAPGRIAEIGTFPTPESYRDRGDLPDDFARGALYGGHVVAYGLPTAAASAAIEAGADRAIALKIHEAAKTDVAFIVGDVTEALSLVPEGTGDAGPYAPTAFGGFDPSAFAGSAR